MWIVRKASAGDIIVIDDGHQENRNADRRHAGADNCPDRVAASRPGLQFRTAARMLMSADSADLRLHPPSVHRHFDHQLAKTTATPTGVWISHLSSTPSTARPVNLVLALDTSTAERCIDSAFAYAGLIADQSRQRCRGRFLSALFAELLPVCARALWRRRQSRELLNPDPRRRALERRSPGVRAIRNDAQP